MTFLKAHLGIGKMPQIGELWTIDDPDAGPWPLENQIPVKIIDVKEGWVRFSWLGTHHQTDDRLRMRLFRWCYNFYRAS